MNLQRIVSETLLNTLGREQYKNKNIVYSQVHGLYVSNVCKKANVKNPPKMVSYQIKRLFFIQFLIITTSCIIRSLRGGLNHKTPHIDLLNLHCRECCNSKCCITHKIRFVYSRKHKNSNTYS